MTGIFEVLASEENDNREANRKALTVARVRARERFGSFIGAAKTRQEFDQRFALIEDDYKELVRVACEEHGCVDQDAVDRSLRESFEIRESVRRPRMCPYHKQIVDASLASGDPGSGYAAMAQHAWSQNHCESSEYEGSSCKFRPEYTTQSYWEERAERSQERKEERERVREEEVQPDAQDPQEAPQEPEAVEETHDEPGINESLEEAPSAVGEGVEEQEFALAKAAGHEPPCHSCGAELFPDDDPGGKYRICPECGAVNSKEDLNQEPGRANVNSRTANTRMAEALKTIDVDKDGEGPSPKMDKSRWNPESLQVVDSEGEGSPNPTRRQDPTQPVDFGSSNPATVEDRLEQAGKAVTEKQDVTQGTEHSQNIEHYPSGSFPNNGTNPVTSKTAGACSECGTTGVSSGEICPSCGNKRRSAEDVNVNPIQDLIDNGFEGFVPQADVQKAVDQYKSNLGE